MLGKGAKLWLINNRRENLFGIFHRNIIALVFCAFLLGGCGYKTKPVYLGCGSDSPRSDMVALKESIEKV